MNRTGFGGVAFYGVWVEGAWDGFNSLQFKPGVIKLRLPKVRIVSSLPVLQQGQMGGVRLGGQYALEYPNGPEKNCFSKTEDGKGLILGLFLVIQP